MKYNRGQKVQDRRDNIRYIISDCFECSEPRYWVGNKSGDYEFYESELELVLEARVFEFILRIWNFIKSDWIVSAVIFVLGFIGGILI